MDGLKHISGIQQKLNSNLLMLLKKEDLKEKKQVLLLFNEKINASILKLFKKV